MQVSLTKIFQFPAQGIIHIFGKRSSGRARVTREIVQNVRPEWAVVFSDREFKWDRYVPREFIFDSASLPSKITDIMKLPRSSGVIIFDNLRWTCDILDTDWFRKFVQNAQHYNLLINITDLENTDHPEYAPYVFPRYYMDSLVMSIITSKVCNPDNIEKLQSNFLWSLSVSIEPEQLQNILEVVENRKNAFVYDNISGDMRYM